MFDESTREMMEGLACEYEASLYAGKATARDRSDAWSSGFHIDQFGKKHLITEMSDYHLKNTIRHFRNHEIEHDVSALVLEEKRRWELTQ